MRSCLTCGNRLIRRERERPAEFRRRTYCSRTCAVRDRTRKAAERQAAAELAEVLPVTDGLTFDPGQILHRARAAAPQVPISLLADVVAAVEPMIAANARRALLAPIAADIRARRKGGHTEMTGI